MYTFITIVDTAGIGVGIACNQTCSVVKVTKAVQSDKLCSRGILIFSITLIYFYGFKESCIIQFRALLTICAELGLVD